MAVVYLTRETLPEFRRRIDRLSPDLKPQFGSMSVVAMLRHMRNAIETALGETDLPDVAKPVVGRLLYLFSCHVLTSWPRGRIKAPDWWVPPPEKEYDEERRLFLAALERFVDAHADSAKDVVHHPMFGPLRLHQWSRLNGIHLDHHLKQFAV